MARNTRAASNFTQPIKSDGTFPSDTGSLGRSTYALATGGTYYVEIPATDTATLLSTQIRWGAALAATITIESTNLAEKDAPLKSTDATLWLQENPTTSGITVTGAGNSITNLTVTAGGTNAGAVLLDLGNIAAARLRIKFANITTGGDMQVSSMSKP